MSKSLVFLVGLSVASSCVMGESIEGPTPGTVKWSFDANRTNGSSTLAIGPDGTVYAGSLPQYGSYLGKTYYALDGQTGELKWSFDANESHDHSVLKIGSGGSVHVGIRFHALDGQTGTERWRKELEGDLGDTVVSKGTVYSSPAIGSDGTVYFGSRDNKLYAIKTASKGPAKSPWPMFGQNAQRTRRAPKR